MWILNSSLISCSLCSPTTRWLQLTEDELHMKLQDTRWWVGSCGISWDSVGPSFLSLIFPWNSSLSKNGGIDYGSLKIGIIQTSERWERGLNVQHNRAFRKSGLYSDFVSTSSMIAMQICNLSYSYALSCMFLGKYFKWILSQQDQSSYIHTNFHPISCTWNFSVHLTNNNKHYVSTITHFGWAKLTSAEPYGMSHICVCTTHACHLSATFWSTASPSKQHGPICHASCYYPSPILQATDYFRQTFSNATVKPLGHA